MRTWLHCTFNVRIEQTFGKNYLKFENLHFLNESNPKKFSSFSKATGSQISLMKNTLSKKNSPLIHSGWRVLLVQMCCHKTKKKNFHQMNIQTCSALKKTTFALIKRRECYMVNKKQQSSYSSGKKTYS